ncbi:hypothetical protein D9615_000114 [Tricholomella constricta]|uniref:Protein-lysine N-methyltransferase EFM6 n=1 Tax=Tricholomella constricta TaxID=117010 RepID=A0A8H5HRU5_9AGAR|nr:hypothetical protein D9615_000114 [Tricholomella constricta]
MPFHDDLALDEHLDDLDPLRHLMQQPDSDESDLDLDLKLALLPQQPRSIYDETLHLSFISNPDPITISLAVDAAPGCGGIAWPAGEVLASFLAKQGAAYVRGRTILELGSGTGLVGLVAAKLGGTTVCITDQAMLLDIMRRNVRANALQDSVRVAELNWGTPLPQDISPPDLILAADCVYYEPAFPLLVQTLADLVDLQAQRGKDTDTEVLFCYKKRRKADKRFFALLKKGFSWTEVMDDPDREVYTRDAISLLRLFRRKDHKEEARRRIA